MAVESCDEGSLPFVGDFQLFSDGASKYGQLVDDHTELFENKVLASFIDKIEAGISLPNYPQYRDMNQMLFEVIEGIGKIDGGYIETTTLTLKKGKSVLPEVSVIKTNLQKVYEKLGKSIQLRICIAGPYTLSSLLAYKDKNTFTRLGNVLTELVAANVFEAKQGRVVLVSVDEPVFGFVDDPLLDRGSEGRENLLKAWESIAQKIHAKGAQACLHLHNTSDELYWEAKNLDIIESHVSDPIYQAKRTKERLESTDKFLKASIAITDFDQLIRDNLTATSKKKINNLNVNEQVAETWNALKKRQLNSMVFIEKTEQMKKRLTDVVELFGDNRVLYAGPECGLKGFPTYESAMECLKRVSEAVITP